MTEGGRGMLGGNSGTYVERCQRGHRCKAQQAQHACATLDRPSRLYHFLFGRVVCGKCWDLLFMSWRQALGLLDEKARGYSNCCGQPCPHPASLSL